MLLVLSFCTQCDLSKSEHMAARVAHKVSINLKLGWVQFDEVTCRGKGYTAISASEGS